MTSVSYQITALVVRYILIAIVLVVFLRAVSLGRRSKTGAPILRGFLIQEKNGKQYPLGDDNIIGSSPRCDIVLKGRSLAGVHVQIYRKKKRWLLSRYTTNRTEINEVDVNSRVEVHNGDTLQMGSHLFTLQIDDEEGEA